jgi:uncharacterized membrane protein
MGWLEALLTTMPAVAVAFALGQGAWLLAVILFFGLYGAAGLVLIRRGRQ